VKAIRLGRSPHLGSTKLGRRSAAPALLLVAIGSLESGLVQAAPVQPGLDRPALVVRQPERAMLMGVATAGTRLVAVGERGVVSLSDDGGRKWRQASVPVSVTLTAVRFANDRFGMATGHGGVVLATADRGESWKVVLDGRRLAQVVLDRARALGGEAGIKEAERLVADGPDKPLLDLVVLDERRAWVVGAYGLALTTEDGGATWSSWGDRLENPKAQHIYVVRKRGDTVLLAGEQGLLLLSLDGGQRFKRIDSPYRGSWFTAELIDDRSMLVAGLRGNTWRSLDGGANWSALPVPPGASVTASTVTNEGRLLLSNQAGFVMSVEGVRVVALHEKPVPSVAGLTALGGQIVTVGVQGARALQGPASGPLPPVPEKSR
jgi:photosystem II stability/assembly factor-like uncharacterized protein